MIESELDLTPYAGRWVALVDNAGTVRVAGVGQTATAARRFAKRNRPKEKVQLHFVERLAGTPLTLSPLLDRLRPFLNHHPDPVYLVGGAVRDGVLGRASHDLDFVVARDAVALAFRMGDVLGVPAYPLDTERDTGRVVLANEATTLDVARFRGPDLEADLRARDFTVNAMALPATARFAESIIDPCGGLDDLQAGRIRLTHETAIADDPVRGLRAVRLALTLGFALVAETKTAVSAAASRLSQISNERIRDELLKLLSSDHPDQAINELAEYDLLPIILPDVAALADVEQSSPHHKPVLAHTVSVLRWLRRLEQALFADDTLKDLTLQQVREVLADHRSDLVAHMDRVIAGGLDGRALLRLGALFHDVGKKETKSVENGRIRFLGHDKVGADIAAARLRHLALSNEAVRHVKAIVRGHMRPLLLVQAQGASPSRRAVYRFFRDVDAAGLDIGLLSLADHLATHNGSGDGEQWQDLVGLVGTLFDHYFNRAEQTVKPPPLINGRDLIDVLQLEPGPEIGRLLRLVEEAQAAGDVETRAEALQLARQAQQ